MWFRKKKEGEAAQAGRMRTTQESQDQEFPNRERNSMQELRQAGGNAMQGCSDAGRNMSRTSGIGSSSVQQTLDMGSGVQQPQWIETVAVKGSKGAGGQKRRNGLRPVLRLSQYMEQGNRKYQQDAVYVSATGTVPLFGNKMVRVLAVVCDGMGGMEDGGKASRTAVQMLGKDFARIKDDPRIPLPAFLLSEVQRIDRLIYHYSGGASGTTIVAAAVENDRLYWISAGDSRMYLLRQGRLERQTQDHNYMFHLMQMGMTIEEARAQKGSEALISFLGIGNISSAGLISRNLRPIQLRVNDILLLCSDGITKTIPDGQIREILMSQASGVGQKAQALVQTATRKNTRSQDNTSALVLEYTMESIGEFCR